MLGIFNTYFTFHGAVRGQIEYGWEFNFPAFFLKSTPDDLKSF